MAGRFNGLVNKLPSTQAQFIWSNVPAYELVPMCNPTPDCNTFRWSRLDAAPSPGPRHQQDQLSVHSAGAAPVIIMTLHGGGRGSQSSATQRKYLEFNILSFLPLPLYSLLQITDPFITTSLLSVLYQMSIIRTAVMPSCSWSGVKIIISWYQPPPHPSCLL